MSGARVGDRIAGYRIERELGHGGMSVVYLADHERLERKVALKVLASQLAENAKFRERFLRESKIAASIDHPNIVPIYDADEADGVLYIAMRYVEGTDLKRLIRERDPLAPERVASIVTQLAAALDAAHAKDLVHRDVKPGNVLVVPPAIEGGSDHVYLADFGLTRRSLSMSGLTESGQLLGTVDYIAPEQIRGDPLDGRADVYAVGCVIFECLTGHVPFERESEVAVLWAHVQDPPPRPSDARPELPVAVDDVIARAMAKDPQDRPLTAGSVAAELRAALGLVPGPDGGGRGLTGRARRRRRRLMGVAVAALIVAVVVGAWLVSGGGSSGPVVPGPDTVARIDVDGAAFADAFPVGMTPVGVAYGDGSVWVINERDKTFQRIDPVSGAELVARSALGTPTGVAWGEEALWITNGFGNPEGGTPVVRVEPTDATPRVFFDAPGGKSIVVAFASVWVGDETRGVVRRYEALTGSELAAVPIEGGGPLALAVGTGAAEGIWVADPLNDRVHMIDPETDEVTSSIEVADPTAVAAGDAGVWVTSGANDTITRFDPDGTTIATLSLARGVDVPDAPSTLVIAGDSVWVASDAETLVTRVDVRTNQIVGSLPTTGIVDGMTVDDTGDVWLTVRAP